MELRNFTPLRSLYFESRDEKQHDFGVLVLRGTFRMENGRALAPEPNQQPLIMSDEYNGEPGTSSLRMENNLAPFKPKTDVHINAFAHAPGGIPVSHWGVRVEVGELCKELLVTGERWWRRSSLRGWHLTEPIPCERVPIRYEHAYGGSCLIGERSESYEENPVGVGYINREVEANYQTIPAPRIISPIEPAPIWGKVYRPEGLGPIGPGWLPRHRFAGTLDDEWLKNRWPDLPSDFQYNFYNSAHPSLVYPGFMRGDEAVSLFNLEPTGRLAFSLPGYRVAMLARWLDGAMSPLPMVLDSIHLEVPQQRAYLTWRGILSLSRPLRVLEARMQGWPQMADVIAKSGQDDAAT